MAKFSLSKNACELIDIMKSRSVDRDTCVGIILVLKSEENYLKLLNWIKKKPDAGQTEIMKYHMKLAPIEKGGEILHMPAPLPRAVKRV